MLSRPLYRFGRFELKTIPKPQRGRALELQIKQWSPYLNTGQYVVWSGDDALVWAWDSDRLRASLEEHKLTPKRVRVIPETLLQQPHDNGIYLHECLDGFEGQIWHDRALISSRWWAKTPDGSEWLSFQRDACVLPEQQLRTVPAPLASAWQERPWGRPVNLGEAIGATARGEPFVVTGGIVALALTTFWYAANLVKLHQAHEMRVAELHTLERRAGPMQLARSQALDELARVKALQSLSLHPDHLSLMAKAAERLPQNGAYLKEWEYHGGKLKIVITSPNKLVSSDYVKSYQVAGLFENVQAPASSDPTSMILTMDVVPQVEIKFADEKADAAVKEPAPQARMDSPGVKTPKGVNPEMPVKK